MDRIFKTMKTESILTLCTKKDDFETLNDLAHDYIEAVAAAGDNAVQKRILKELIRRYVDLEKRVDALLKNTLPVKVADEIKYEGMFAPRPYECTILFSDFIGFTKLAENISGAMLIDILNRIFISFDDLIASYNGTKIKTIGDAYMAVFGAPSKLENHAAQAVRAGLSLQRFLADFNILNKSNLQMRVGIHTGSVMAGVVGKERMQFDVFGDSVNIASRFESAGEEGKVNVSETTYLQTAGFFEYRERGMISLKNKESMKAYFAVKET